MKNKNRVFTLACMSIVALISTLGAYAQDQDQDKDQDKNQDQRKIAVTLSNDSWNHTLMYALSSQTEEGKKSGYVYTMKPNDQRTIELPSDTVTIDISSSVQK